MTNLYRITILIVVAGACYSIGRFTGPTKVEVKEVEKVVYQERTIKERERNTRETRLPDGTIVKETNTRIHTDSDIGTTRDSSKQSTTESRPSWRISGGYIPAIPSFQEPRYMVGVERQIIGEIYAGVVASSDKTIGVTISIGF